MTMTTLPLRITAGVDTHLDVHVVAALDERGALLGVESFETTVEGYRRTLVWLREFGTVELVGVEGTGSYGAGLTRHLLAEGIAVVEVDRPNRQRRRKRGKSDPQDAITAARAAQSGDALGAAKTRDGNVEAMRVLRIARHSARKARTQALNQMRSIISTAPDEIRTELRDLNVYRLLERARGYRPGPGLDVHTVTKRTLRTLARRATALEDEITDIDAALTVLVAETAPELVARPGVGTDTASALLVAAGEPRPAPQRSDIRTSLRRVTHRRQQRHPTTTSPQPRRRPPSQQRALEDRAHPHGLRPENTPLHRSANERRPHQERSHPMPQALHRPRGLQPPTTPTTRT
jgi:transposase